MKTKSLKIKVTLLSASVLLVCIILITLTTFYNADTHFSDINIYKSNTQLEENVEISPIYTKPIDKINEAKKQFNIIGILISFIVFLLGILAIYLVVGSAFKPLDKLSEEISLITENSLDTHITNMSSSYEVSNMCNSFNLMLDRLINSFHIQNKFNPTVSH